MNRTPSSQHSAPVAIRVDKWLKMARIYKSREEAAADCALGRIKVNEHVAKASKEVKAGDVIVLKRGNHYRTLEIKQIPVRGLSAKDAREIYHEKTPAIPERFCDFPNVSDDAGLTETRRVLPVPTL